MKNFTGRERERESQRQIVPLSVNLGSLGNRRETNGCYANTGELTSSISLPIKEPSHKMVGSSDEVAT